jgi:hypothetical protein
LKAGGGFRDGRLNCGKISQCALLKLGKMGFAGQHTNLSFTQVPFLSEESKITSMSIP